MGKGSSLKLESCVFKVIGRMTRKMALLLSITKKVTVW